jgi:hypothetical protein
MCRDVQWEFFQMPKVYMFVYSWRITYVAPTNYNVLNIYWMLMFMIFQFVWSSGMSNVLSCTRK